MRLGCFWWDLLGCRLKNRKRPYAGRVSSDDRASVRDPWGMEILYIHPTEENEKAFEAFGKPLNERPYFMSAGPDGEYETLDDNIYSYEVDKPREGRG